MEDNTNLKEEEAEALNASKLIMQPERVRGNSKILAKIGNSVVKPLLKTVQTGEKRREIKNRNA